MRLDSVNEKKLGYQEQLNIDFSLENYLRSKLHFEQTPLGVIEWDTNFRIIKWNPSAERIFGYREEEAIGKLGTELVPAPSPEKVYAVWSELITKKGGSRSTNENITKDKRIIYCDWYNTPLVDNSGNVIGVASLVQDITERIKSEKIQKALYSISQAVHTIEDIDDLYEEIHEIVKSLMKADNFYIALYDECKGLISFPYFVDEFDSKPPPRKLGRGLTEFVLRTKGDYLIDAREDLKLRANGETDLIGAPAEIWLGVTLKINNQPIGVLVVQDYNDKTTYGEEEKQILNYVSEQIAFVIDRKQNEKALKKYSHELQELIASKDKFFSIIAHDLRSPFNGLLGLSELLVNSYNKLTEDERKSFIYDIYSTTRSVFGLIENLLHWSRLQTGKMLYVSSKLNLFDLIESVYSTLTNSAKLKSIKLLNNLPDPTIVFGDADMLRSLFQNLISNGIKFTPKGGSVTVNVTPCERGNPVISVEDTGVGIKDENLTKLFMIDQGFSSKGTENEEGTGLGLLICKDVVEKHGSQLLVSSIINKGTTFSFQLKSQAG